LTQLVWPQVSILYLESSSRSTWAVSCINYRLKVTIVWPWYVYSRRQEADEHSSIISSVQLRPPLGLIAPEKYLIWTWRVYFWISTYKSNSSEDIMPSHFSLICHLICTSQQRQVSFFWFSWWLVHSTTTEIKVHVQWIFAILIFSSHRYLQDIQFKFSFESI
jgi:hypothetical protein